jgi:hypothetical protein
MSLKKSAYPASILLMVCSAVFAQGPSHLRNEQPPIPVDEIIRKFAEKEKLFKLARANYVYRQDNRVQSLTADDRVTGEWHEVWDITYDPRGRRVERVVSAPPNTLKDVQLTDKDLQNFREVQPFVLTSDDVGKYSLKYLGKEKIDEIDCYVFDVAPKTIEKNQQYFQGQIWVDDKDLQIVKTYGKPVPEIRKGEENLFPRFETYREQIDGKYWFPTYTRSLDTLNFSTGAKRIRQVVKYENYKQFQSDVKLTFGDSVENDSSKGTAPSGDNKAPALDPNMKSTTTTKKK